MNQNKIEFSREELIQKLFELVFEKVKRESKKSNAYGISKYLNELLDNKINERTLTRYYDGYILGKDNERTTPNEYNLDVLSEYLEYDNFKKFEKNIEFEIEKEKLRKEKREVKIKLKKNRNLGLLIGSILFVVSAFFISKYFEKNCMIWVDDHYEKIKCSGLENEKKLDELELKNFKMIEVCKDSTFFINGDAVIHYTRHNNNIDFFTDDGEHPIYCDVYTDPITQTIIDSRVKPCDSVKLISK